MELSGTFYPELKFKKETDMNTKIAKIVTITSKKGGAGKTAITSLLARYLAEIENRTVLVIDFDGRGGITSLFHKDPVTRQTPSIVEIILETNQRQVPEESFSQALIHTKLETRKSWGKNKGSIYLIPSRPDLDHVLPGKSKYILGAALCSLELPEEYIILIDSGPDSINVQMSIAAADVVFVPMKLSKQDVHPTIETVKSIFNEQKNKRKTIWGGFIINQDVKTQREETYLKKYRELYKKFKMESGLNSINDDLFILLRESRIIRSGNHLVWPMRDDFLESSSQIASTIHKAQNTDIGEFS